MLQCVKTHIKINTSLFRMVLNYRKVLLYDKKCIYLVNEINKIMISIREIEKGYKKMLDIDELKGDVKKNDVNCYTCECGHITKTIDVDKGVTPFMHQCEKCDSFAKSSFYNDIAPHIEPTQEWYRPTLEQVIKMRKNKFGQAMIDHILQGGLDVRNIEK